MHKPELLLPVGNMDMCLAAIHNGADAIYIGSPVFNARGRAKEHSIEEIKEIIDLCHLYGVQVHIALNVVIFESELETAIEVLKSIIALGPDALIIQDLGLVKLIRQISSTQIIHGSTQMSLTNHEGIKLLDDLDISRFVLGRENTLEEIKAIKANTSKELEVFVHGALCVAYSGQCFTSESLGGRSANRGQCAQSCRFEYDLIVDGEIKDLNGKKYLVSPKDLCGIDEVGELKEIGVNSLKVEGRLKSSDFVGTAARSYREVIDKEYKNKGHQDEKGASTDQLKLDMASSFSRGFYSGWLNGVAHQELVEGEYQNHRGHKLGEYDSFFKGFHKVRTQEVIEVGDGLLFVEKERSIGSVVTFVNKTRAGVLEVKLRDNLEIAPESAVYLNSKNSVKSQIRKSVSDDALLKRIPIEVRVEGEFEKPLRLSFDDGNVKVEVQSTQQLERANKEGSNKENIKKEVSKLGRTVYVISNIKIAIEPNLYIPQKTLKQLKNRAVLELNKKRVTSQIDLKKDFKLETQKVNSPPGTKKLNTLVRNLDQLKSLAKLKTSKPELFLHFGHVILDYEFGKDFIPSVRICKELELKVVIATTRILKPGEYHNFTLIKRADPDGILVRNLGALEYFKSDNFKLYGDFSLNASNSITTNYLVHKGLRTLCLSYDLNKEQLDNVIDHVDSSKLEVTLYQYMPEFHMEHCVFAAFMSKGNSFRDCGKPCEKHEVALQDMYGNRHEIKADQECRNTMFNAKAQSALNFVEEWSKSGVTNFRFEALHETCDEFRSKVELLLSLFAGDISLDQVQSRIGGVEKYGITQGQLLNARTYKDRKKDDKNRRV